MNTNITTTDNRPPSPDSKQSPPAFLDLADSAARRGTNLPDMSARVELKRLEHEHQRAIQRRLFEDQMRALERKQAQELLSLPYDANLHGPTGIQHLAVSAPTTPPRVNALLNGDVFPSGRSGRVQFTPDAEILSKAVGSVADKRKSVTYAPSINISSELVGPAPNGQSFARPVGAKSMPASRRTSASSHDEELANHLQNLALVGERSNRASPAPIASVLPSGGFRYGEEDSPYHSSMYNAGMMLDEQLDKEMHNAMRNLPTSDEDKPQGPHSEKVSMSSALDLAHISQTSPRAHFASRALDSREKSSEWPQFTTTSHCPDGLLSRADRRTVTNPNLTISTPTDDRTPGSMSANVSPHIPQGPTASRRGSPRSLLDGLSAATRSVPTTPLGLPSNTAGHLLKTPGTPLSPDPQLLSGRISTPGSHSLNDGAFDSLQSAGIDDPSYAMDPMYALDNGLEGNRYSSYNFDTTTRNTGPPNAASTTTGSTALYHHNGTRYGLGLPVRAGAPTENKLNGFHGPKHKRGDIDREFNRFAGTRLEDLQGEIPSLCRDQHGCRYLQKKLEEGVAEHRDMIFRETFSHFAELMTDPFGNYLCQKLLEYCTDEQRNLICESVAQDLVSISLNMHGTRAVQKMIDFLSTRRQIRSIIVALSLHVVVLIKDLNGNHVIQKCLNKLAPEDNQFIYNAVAANCVEVATHRHGCCVLQRCIDHASDHQRIQLVNEITYNALTLVQDPYGNYVVQYILDLNDNRFSDAIIRQFFGNVCALSVQKFSSNVIEKCVRVAEQNTRKLLIDEFLNRTRLEKLLRDSYGNYCVQTALDYAEPGQRALLVEGIRPVLPLIRNTPYGKRIQNKLQREHVDHYGSYHNQHALVNMSLGNQGLSVPHGAGRHISQTLPHTLTDIYGNGLYAMPQNQTSFVQPHVGTGLHGLQPQSIDGYVLQSSSTHQGLSPMHSPAYSRGSFSNVNPFGGAGLANALNDPYQRTEFGYM
ncbi:hypothetical protein APHAL10511_006189 [Amanita phalloides]|nr:hypothetical protein APHAL10511_006189 [Amanita phalloides]